MMEATPRDQLLREFADAYEQLMKTATEAAERGMIRQGNTWGPREIVAHLAGWEVMATVRIPSIVAGMPPFEYTDDAQQEVMDDAINATIVTMVGEQSLDTICGMLRRAYHRVIEILRSVDDTFFQPGAYVYERTKSAIEHCEEHLQSLGTH
ncbi:MAG: ClbS/DfsB family four-helix bundle protein [Ktedonobacterales bacterium]